MQSATEREGTPADETGRRHPSLLAPLLPVTPLNDEVIAVMVPSPAASLCVYISAALTVS